MPSRPFAGFMGFAYIHDQGWARAGAIHSAKTTAWSLEAIFLSAFVLIGQNRQASFQLAKADHDYIGQEQELRTNTDLTRAIHTLATEIHSRVVTR